jgi:hypothetical protein
LTLAVGGRTAAANNAAENGTPRDEHPEQFADLHIHSSGAVVKGTAENEPGGCPTRMDC